MGNKWQSNILHTCMLQVQVTLLSNGVLVAFYEWKHMEHRLLRHASSAAFRVWEQPINIARCEICNGWKQLCKGRIQDLIKSHNSNFQKKEKKRIKTNTPKNTDKQNGKCEEINQKNGQRWNWIGNREMGMLLWLIQCHLPDLQAVVWADGCNGQAVKWVILDPVWQQSGWSDEEHQRQHIKRHITHNDTLWPQTSSHEVHMLCLHSVQEYSMTIKEELLSTFRASAF